MSVEKSNKIEDWWTDWQKGIVADTSRIWEKKKFKNVARFRIVKDGDNILGKVCEHEKLPNDAVIDNDAWDHEHCELCWQKISESIDDEHEGYTGGKDWICFECYNKYIDPKNNL